MDLMILLMSQCLSAVGTGYTNVGAIPWLIVYSNCA